MNAVCDKELSCGILWENVLFGFCLDGKRYLVTQEPDPEAPFGCMAVDWNIYAGYTVSGNEADERAAEAACYILTCAQKKKDGFPFRGEWYRVYLRNGEAPAVRRQGKGSVLWRGAVPFALQSFSALMLAVLALFLLKDRVGAWLGVLFPSPTPYDGEILLTVLEIVAAGLLFLVLRHRRELSDMLWNAFLPLLTVTAFGMLKSSPEFLIFLPLLVFLVYEIVSKQLKKGGRVRCSDKLRHTLMASLLLLCLMIPCFGVNQPSDIRQEYDGEMTEVYLEQCRKLERHTWSALSREERLAVLQEICDYECLAVLGMDRVSVIPGEPSSEGALAEYSDSDRSFTIDAEYLESGSAENVVETVLHELRHAYQYRMAELYELLEEQLGGKYLTLYPLRQAEAFGRNLSDYRVVGIHGYDAYYEQTVEVDSRAWSEYRFNEGYWYYIYSER